MAAVRTERVNAEIQKNLAEILRGLKDPDFTAMVSVMRVDTAHDLKHSNVYLSFYPSGSAKEGLAAVEKAAGFIRKQLASRMNAMRCVPELHYKIDDSLEYSRRLSGILDGLNEK